MRQPPRARQRSPPRIRGKGGLVIGFSPAQIGASFRPSRFLIGKIEMV
jgi:hypothetical protein